MKMFLYELISILVYISRFYNKLCFQYIIQYNALNYKRFKLNRKREYITVITALNISDYNW